MAKSRAQYQKEYRERKKLNDASYLEKERLRTKHNRVSVKELSKRKQDEVRQRNKVYSQTYRYKKKLSKAIKRSTIPSEPEQSSSVSSSTDETSVTNNLKFTGHVQTRDTSSNKQLFVKLQFPKKRATPMKRFKALKRAGEKIKNLEMHVNELTKQKACLKKRLQRIKKNYTKSDEKTSGNPYTVTLSEGDHATLTPKSKTKHDFKRMGINMTSASRKVVKKLQMSNTVLAEVREACKQAKKQKERRVLMNVVGGKIAQKYRCLDAIRRETGLGRKGMRTATTKVVTTKGRKRLELKRQMMRQHVLDFMERDDISIQMPGKNDKKIHEGKERQVRFLNDYLENIFNKYRDEYLDKKKSKTVFSRFRPQYILLTNFISRNTCLCSKHQNIATKLKGLRACGVQISPNPETVSKTVSFENMVKTLENLDDSKSVKYEEWRRVNDDGKKRMKIIVIEDNKKDFMEVMIKEYEAFLSHVYRVRAQYAAMRQLKSNLPKNHVAVNMDFAENYTCGNVDEVQSAYWNATPVTLHPVVVYFNDENESLQHKNYIFVSDVGNHNTAAVYTILKTLVPDIKKLLPCTEMIHYWTDSPSSQYRNRFVFDILLRHVDLFGTKARWNYYESGHGKGPCDGLGGVAKRQASAACKQGKVNIQDGRDFFAWAKDNQKKINYHFYTQEEYDLSCAELDTRKPKVVQGTMKQTARCNAYRREIIHRSHLMLLLPMFEE